MTLTRERARQVWHEQSQWPYWGNFSRFMTEAEIAHVQYLFENAKSGGVSFGSIVGRIAIDLKLELKEGVPSWEEFSNPKA